MEEAVSHLRSGFAPTSTALSTPTAEAGESYVARASSGHVRAVIAAPGRAQMTTRAGADRTPEGLALAFLREHRRAFGWASRGASLQAHRTRKDSGRSFVRFEQRYAGLPVFGAGAAVQVEADGGVTFALVDVARDGAAMYESSFPTTPLVEQGAASSLALRVVSAYRGELRADLPELMIFEPSVIGHAGPSVLVWRVRVRGAAGDVDEEVFVDAEASEVVFRYSRIASARNRSIFDASNVPGSLGTLVRAEGGPVTGIADVDLAYQYVGDTYDYYFSRFGRDSYDGLGAALIGRVRYCELPSCPFANAFWNGSEMRFGQGYAAADDVVAHELTHGVTERESNLIYWGESGAINEALSDVFGEILDQGNGAGVDTSAVRWQVGEDLPGGAIRSMADPTLFGDPDRRFSPNWYTGGEDNRGVHFNSGVANKLAYLLSDGGSFNGQTVPAQGTTAVARLFYEANVNLLVPGSDYFDLYAALRQAAANLVWSAAGREALETASRAVEIALPGGAVVLFQDGFEGAFPGSWQVLDNGGPAQTGIGTQWGRSTQRFSSGAASAYCAAGGSTPAPAGGPYPPNMNTWMVYGPFSMASLRRAWTEFDLFLDLEYPFDDVFWGVSTDGLTFDGYAISPGPDGTTPGWVHEVFDFDELGPASPVGERQVWLGFNFASDDIVQYEGAYIDNVVIRGTGASSTIGVWRPAERVWYLRNQNSTGSNEIPAILYGATEDIPVAGDWDGDGVETIGVYRPSTHVWYLRNSNSSGFNDVPAILYGADGDIPIVGDWNGDGIDTIGVYRPSTHVWYLRNSNSSGFNDIPAVLYGADGDTPVVGDWNADGTDTIGIYRPAERVWYLRDFNSSGFNTVPAILYGASTDRPVIGNWDGF